MAQNLLHGEELGDSSTDADLPTLPGAMRAVLGSSTARTFEEALWTVADEVMLGKPIPFRMLVAGRPRALNSYIEEEVCLIAREALLNALLHSEATSVEAEIEYLPGKFRVIVRDDGRGMGSQTMAGNSHGGLVEMRERAGNIGGALRVWSRRGAGTEVEICVPAM